MKSIGWCDRPAHAQVLATQVKQVHGGDGFLRRLLGLVLDEPVALVPVRGAALLQLARLDRPKRFKHTVQTDDE